MKILQGSLHDDQAKRHRSKRWFLFLIIRFRSVLCHLRYKRGEIKINANGSRQKFDGQSWRSVCTYNDCISYIVARGYCHRHDVEMQKKNSKVVSSMNNIPKQPTVSQTPIKRLMPSFISKKLKKGEIRLVRQEWNGTKWYSLCHHPSLRCQRRSGGMKFAYLCEEHFQDCKTNKTFNDVTDEVLVSPTIKRKKSKQFRTRHSYYFLCICSF